MSESLKERLSSHSNSFEGLLSLIPARYYYDDESNSQWKKGTASAEERKAESQNARKNKFDPEVGTSALDEIKRREKLASTQEAANETDSEKDDSDIVIYDDYGNPISGHEEESIADILKAKAQNGGDSAPPAAAPQPAKPKESNKPAKKEKTKPAPAPEPKKPEPKRAPKEQPEAKASKSSENNRDVTASMEAQTETDVTPSTNGETDATSKKSRQGIEELRARLAARVNELRAKRKAPGSDAQGAPKNREELLAARKLRLEQKKMQSKNKDVDESDDDDEEEDDDDNMDYNKPYKSATSKHGDDDLDSSLMFGQVQFKDGARLSKDITSLEEQRKHKKRNATDQLRVLENRKAKISKLDDEKQREIAENAKWSRAVLQTEGAKIRDDEKLLRKTIRQKENRKKRSEKEWKQRIYNVKKGISDRESKRHANIAAHKEAKKLHLKGKKRKQHMKAAAMNHKAH